MRIGIDFDNTIAGYDAAFLAAAQSEGLVERTFTGGKTAVREAVRNLEDGERKWQALQGRVYGAHMDRAALIPGVAEFLKRCADQAHDVFIVSHKTEYGHFDPDRINLRKAAMAWMEKQGFFRSDGGFLSPNNVFFESTRAEKIERIKALSFDIFIDDLPEVLSDPAFPTGPQRVLFDPGGLAGPVPYDTATRWMEITEGVLHGAA